MFKLISHTCLMYRVLYLPERAPQPLLNDLIRIFILKMSRFPRLYKSVMSRRSQNAPNDLRKCSQTQVMAIYLVWALTPK